MKTRLERETKHSRKALNRMATQIGGPIVETTRVLPQGEPARCWRNAQILQQQHPGSETWYGFRIHPINGVSTDPWRKWEQQKGHLCFEEHWLVRDAQGRWLDNTPVDHVPEDYASFFVAVGARDPQGWQPAGNWEYCADFGLQRTPASIVFWQDK